MNILELIQKYDRIFIDSSTILSHNGQDFLNELMRFDLSDLKGANRFIVSNESALTIDKDSGMTKTHYLRKSLKTLNQRKVLQFKFFDNASYAIIFKKFLNRYSLALITQNSEVSEEIYSQNFEVLNAFGVYKLNLSGSLEPFYKNNEEKTNNQSEDPNNGTIQKPNSNFENDTPKPKKNVSVDTPLSKNPFSKQLIENPVAFRGIEKHDLPLNHQLPKTNDQLLTSDNKHILLTSVLSDKGGEGIVYNTDRTGYVCKIYRRNSLTKHKYEKLNLLVSKPLNDSRIAYPSDLVFFHGKFIGYIMPKVRGDFVGNLFAGLISVNQFKHWQRSDLVEIAINILKIIRKMHSHGILIGDVNRNNFMVEDQHRVYAVDVDSVQVEKYPCPVGVEEFTPPEIIDGNHSYREFFRTYQNEYYSVAVLVFMILTLGAQTTTKIINSHMDTGSLSKIEKIKRQSFGFTLDERETKSQQNSINFATWSRLPSYIKEAFYHTFNKGGKYNSPNHRLSTQKWLQLLLSYKFHLKDGTLANLDPNFNDLISRESVPFSSMKLNPISIKDISFTTLSLESLNETPPKVLSYLESHKLQKITQSLIELGQVRLPDIKMSIVKNYGFMFQIQGTAIVSEGG